MINDFLSDILKVVIVLDVFGIIAYFLLGLKTKSLPNSIGSTAQENGPIEEQRDLFGPGFLNPAVATSQSPTRSALAQSPGVWKRMRLRLSRKRRSLHRAPAKSQTLAMGRLRGVLDSYERGLSI